MNHPSSTVLSEVLDDLKADLRVLYVQAGAPSTRTVASLSGGAISHDTVHRLLRRDHDGRVPRWPPLKELVIALGGDDQHFQLLWSRARDAHDAEIARREQRNDFVNASRLGRQSAARDLAWPSNSLLSRLKEGSRQELLNIGTIVRYPADKEVIEQDANDTHVLLLLDGVVKVQASDETGNTALLAIRVTGDLVGEMSALDQKPRSATVMTCGEVMAKMISSAELTAFLHRRPEALIELVGMVGDRLRWSDQRRRDFLSYPAPQRVARVVYELVQTYGREEPEGWIVGVPLTKIELASIAGMKPRTAEKAFSDLRRAGVVVSHLRRNFVVPDLERLHEFAFPIDSGALKY